VGSLSYIQTLWSGDFTGFGQLARIASEGSELLIHDPAGQSLARVTVGAGPIDPAVISTEFLTGPSATREIVLDGENFRLDQGTLDRLGDARASQSAYLDGVGFIGMRVTLVEQEAGGSRYLHVARETGSGIETYRIEATGALTSIGRIEDTATSYAATVAAMATASLGGRDFLIAASQSEHGLSVFEIGQTGALVLRDSLGAAEFLPIDTPVSLQTVEIDGQTFVLLAAQGSSSLTALRLSPDGTLDFTDQVNDQLVTRFGTVTAMDVAQVQGQTVVAVAGNDGGVTLWTLSPSGRLILRDTLVDTVPAALGGVTQLLFADTAGGLELFAVSAGENGIARMRVDLTALGQGGTGANGGSGRDVLFAEAGGGALSGGAGDDILVDGAGVDILFGGAGADEFVFASDARDDELRDFDPAEDRINLSAYPMMGSLADLIVIPTSDGARLTMGGESLRIVTHNAQPLDMGALSGVLLFENTHVLPRDPRPFAGDGAPDLFVPTSAADTMDGGAGIDTVDYSGAAASITLDLAQSSQNAGAAFGDVITNVENVIGTQWGDTLKGDAQSNRIEAGDGNDRIEGQGGMDWILPGLGDDSIDGGGGADMVSYAGFSNGGIIDLAAGAALFTGGNDTLTGIEGATGTSFDDRIIGDAGDNRLRGLGGSDWFIASDGADSYDGGPGRDMVSYVDATAGIGVDLGAGRGLWGMAAGDRFTNVERITGSSHADTFIGGAGEEDFRGLGGADWFVGSSGGQDRYFGGNGADTVSYAMSPGGVVASLAAGGGSGGDAADDVYVDIERLTGSSHDDRLTGDAGDNVLRGLGGADALYGGGGDDLIDGGNGSDRIEGGAGFDTARYALARDQYRVTEDAGVVTVRSLGSDEGVDTLAGIEALLFADDVFLL